MMIALLLTLQTFIFILFSHNTKGQFIPFSAYQLKDYKQKNPLKYFSPTTIKRGPWPNLRNSNLAKRSRNLNPWTSPYTNPYLNNYGNYFNVNAYKRGYTPTFTANEANYMSAQNKQMTVDKRNGPKYVIIEKGESGGPNMEPEIYQYEDTKRYQHPGNPIYRYPIGAGINEQKPIEGARLSSLKAPVVSSFTDNRQQATTSRLYTPKYTKDEYSIDTKEFEPFSVSSKYLNKPLQNRIPGNEDFMNGGPSGDLFNKEPIVKARINKKATTNAYTKTQLSNSINHIQRYEMEKHGESYFQEPDRPDLMLPNKNDELERQQSIYASFIGSPIKDQGPSVQFRAGVVKKDQCDMPTSLRKECGYFGIKRDECEEKGCCWRPLDKENNAPWCFHPTGKDKVPPVPQAVKTSVVKPVQACVPCAPGQKMIPLYMCCAKLGADGKPLNPNIVKMFPHADVCAMPNGERKECGFFGITKQKCEAKKCCWRPLAKGSKEPWCYNPKVGTIGAPAKPPVGPDGKVVTPVGPDGKPKGTTDQSGKPTPPPKEQCEISPAQRKECGFFGIKAPQCLAKGCCWRPLQKGSKAPWCFYPSVAPPAPQLQVGGEVPKGPDGKPPKGPDGKVVTPVDPDGKPEGQKGPDGTPVPPDNEQCEVDPDERKECGYFGIKQPECEGKGCCWKPLEKGSTAPWCFFPAKKEPAAATPGGGDANTPGGGEVPKGPDGKPPKGPDGKVVTPVGPDGKPEGQKGPDGTPVPPDNEQCEVDPDDRKECGYFGIKQPECEGKGCCWKPLEKGSKAPWCFFPAKKEPAPSTPGGGDANTPGGGEVPKGPDGKPIKGTDGEPIKGPDGKPIKGTDEPAPGGGDVNTPGGGKVPKGPDGQPPKGPDGKVVTPVGPDGKPEGQKGPDGTPVPPDNEQCEVDPDERKECGYFGIKQPECEGKGCCWKPLEKGSKAPWCFFPAKKEPAPATPGGGDANTPGGGEVPKGPDGQPLKGPDGKVVTPVGPDGKPDGQKDPDGTPDSEPAPATPGGGDANMPGGGEVPKGPDGKPPKGPDGKVVTPVDPDGKPEGQKGPDGTPVPPDNEQCEVDPDERKECGYFGIKQPECEGKGCCWRPLEKGSKAPWCFFPAKKEPAPSTPGGGDANTPGGGEAPKGPDGQPATENNDEVPPEMKPDSAGNKPSPTNPGQPPSPQDPGGKKPIPQTPEEKQKEVKDASQGKGDENPAQADKKKPSPQACLSKECQGKMIEEMKKKSTAMFDSLSGKGPNHVVELYSLGCTEKNCDNAIGSIKLDGLEVGGGSEGINIVVLTYPGFVLQYSKVYETGKDEIEATKMVEFIKSVKGPSVIMVVVQGEAFAKMTPQAWTEFNSLACCKTLVKSAGSSFAMLTYKGPNTLPWIQVAQRPAGMGASAIYAVLGPDNEYLTFGGSGVTISSLVETVNSMSTQPVTREHKSNGEKDPQYQLKYNPPSNFIGYASAPIESESENEPPNPFAERERLKASLQEPQHSTSNIEPVITVTPTETLHKSTESMYYSDEPSAVDSFITSGDHSRNSMLSGVHGVDVPYVKEGFLEMNQEKRKKEDKKPKIVVVHHEEHPILPIHENNPVNLHHTDGEHHNEPHVPEHDVGPLGPPHDPLNEHTPFIGHLTHTGHEAYNPQQTYVTQVYRPLQHDDHTGNQVYTPHLVGGHDNNEHSEAHLAPGIFSHNNEDDHHGEHGSFSALPVFTDKTHGDVVAISQHTPYDGFSEHANPFEGHHDAFDDHHDFYHGHEDGFYGHHESNEGHQEENEHHEIGYNFPTDGHPPPEMHHHEEPYHHEESHHPLRILNVPHPYLITTNQPMGPPDKDDRKDEHNVSSPLFHNGHVLPPNPQHKRPVRVIYHNESHHDGEHHPEEHHHEENYHHEEEHHHEGVHPVHEEHGHHSQEEQEETSKQNSKELSKLKDKMKKKPVAKIVKEKKPEKSDEIRDPHDTVTPEVQAKLKEMLTTELNNKLHELNLVPSSHTASVKSKPEKAKQGNFDFDTETEMPNKNKASADQGDESTKVSNDEYNQEQSRGSSSSSDSSNVDMTSDHTSNTKQDESHVSSSSSTYHENTEKEKSQNSNEPSGSSSAGQDDNKPEKQSAHTGNDQSNMMNENNGSSNSDSSNSDSSSFSGNSEVNESTETTKNNGNNSEGNTVHHPGGSSSEGQEEYHANNNNGNNEHSTGNSNNENNASSYTSQEDSQSSAQNNGASESHKVSSSETSNDNVNKGNNEHSTGNSNNENNASSYTSQEDSQSSAQNNGASESHKVSSSESSNDNVNKADQDASSPSISQETSSSTPTSNTGSTPVNQHTESSSTSQNHNTNFHSEETGSSSSNQHSPHSSSGDNQKKISKAERVTSKGERIPPASSSGATNESSPSSTIASSHAKNTNELNNKHGKSKETFYMDVSNDFADNKSKYKIPGKVSQENSKAYNVASDHSEDLSLLDDADSGARDKTTSNGVLRTETLRYERCKRFKILTNGKKIQLKGAKKGCIEKTPTAKFGVPEQHMTSLQMNPGFSTLPSSEGRLPNGHDVAFYFDNTREKGMPTDFTFKENTFPDGPNNVYDQGDYVNAAESILQKDVRDAYNTANDILKAEEALDTSKTAQQQQTRRTIKQRYDIKKKKKRNQLLKKSVHSYKIPSLEERLEESVFDW